MPTPSMLHLRSLPTDLQGVHLLVRFSYHQLHVSLTNTSLKAVFPLFGVQLYEGLGIQWATSLLAFLTVAMVPFPCIFFIYGKSIRGKSRFATAG